MIDDYGIGTSSLAHLARSPADAIKIDASLVANVESGERDRAACAAVVALGARLGLDVVAEGVETDAQARILRGQGCPYLQGFLFAEPMTESEMSAYLKAAAARSVQCARSMG